MAPRIVIEIDDSTSSLEFLLSEPSTSYNTVYDLESISCGQRTRGTYMFTELRDALSDCEITEEYRNTYRLTNET